MATKSDNKSATSVVAAVIAIIGSLIGIVYFVMATNNKEFGTMELVQIVFLILTSMSIVLVASMTKNSKDTYFLPYGFGVVTFLLFAYQYMDGYLEKAVSYMSKYGYTPYLGFAFYYGLGCIAFAIGYMCIIGKIKNSQVSIISLATIGGGFLFNFISSSPQTLYRAFRSKQLYELGLGWSEATIKIIRYPIYICIFAALIVLQLKVDKIKKENEKEA